MSAARLGRAQGQRLKPGPQPGHSSARRRRGHAWDGELPASATAADPAADGGRPPRVAGAAGARLRGAGPLQGGYGGYGGGGGEGLVDPATRMLQQARLDPHYEEWQRARCDRRGFWGVNVIRVSP